MTPESDPLSEEVAEEELVEDEDERDTADPLAQSLAHFGTDFDVHGLVRRLESNDILIPTFDPADRLLESSTLEGFQRRFVWNKPQMDRFIESLLLGYPVPGIFLVEEPNRTLLVLDGQQRLRTLWSFFKNEYRNNPYRLENVEKDFNGLGYPTLSEEQRRGLDNTFIHATIIKYEATDRGTRSVYQLFERLNTGGTNLQPQEIRMALFHGPYVGLLRELNDDEAWRRLYGKRSERLKDQELILRFLAFFHRRTLYARPLKSFLNESLQTFLDAPEERRAADERLFRDTCQVILEAIGSGAFRLRRGYLNAALVETLMVGIADRLQAGSIDALAGVRESYDALIADDAFLATLTSATTNEESVATRLSLATQAFRDVR